MDRIELKGVECYGYHGVLEEERRHGQTFFVDLTCWLDFSQATQLDDTVNYAELAQLAHDIVTGEPEDLIEAVAYRIANQALADYEQLAAIEVTVHKPDAPIPLPFRDVAVVARKRR
ncbi:dihydroneopterin aldolase [Corynebacterium pseudodiphtheriticum]|uniref:dihydroneopterin aldolase n=1 Tax=Corynebacterium pseudodiphtheriticum TaxID=37637 RepID=UPI00255064D6|nr:dihydroneopterin aldolase [Corynebacterium pseudodiphtheriticum]MDK8478298.1 dihydroneopterin aldolase [Corynebacterium pseudodiphtheriticum]MDK8487261.1 dihydroneopterin aldolase [Corynebacterium pseudodiphtheriticum]MDK8494559.1 dihydroneopterin aldolase [Corynebacterium pseudodiphtheriticum]MDK8576913.1 dihydroneopterin aldolase [Corynebacterium pseudodiphtheriticum]